VHSDPEIEIHLPLSVWHVVMGCLGKCAYSDVVSVIHAIYMQAAPQLEKAGLQPDSAPEIVEEKPATVVLN